MRKYLERIYAGSSKDSSAQLQVPQVPNQRRSTWGGLSWPDILKHCQNRVQPENAKSPGRCSLSTAASTIPIDMPQPIVARLPSLAAVPPAAGASRAAATTTIPKPRARTEQKKIKRPVVALTTQLSATYASCDPGFRYTVASKPLRILTKPSIPCRNNGYDNENRDYILYVHGILGGENSSKEYRIHDMLGAGTFGQVVKCQDLETGEWVGIKVIKNKGSYYKQSLGEVDILRYLNQEWDSDDVHCILRFKHTFLHQQHLCLVFELLSCNLYEIIKQNKFKGLPIHLVRIFSIQILAALVTLRQAGVIHCDLKPENILLKNLQTPDVKVADFGSACRTSEKIYTYIQSRYYRSPEILLGYKYSSAIDMWSFGCIVAELFLGLPLFPGNSEYNQIALIIEMLGEPSANMIEKGRQSQRFFSYSEKNGRSRYTLKGMRQYMLEQGTTEKRNKRYFRSTNLKDLIYSYPMPRKQMCIAEKERELDTRATLVDFLENILRIDPLSRYTPLEAQQHPFITGGGMETRYVTGSSTTPASKLLEKELAEPRFVDAQASLKDTRTDAITGALATGTTSMSDEEDYAPWLMPNMGPKNETNNKICRVTR